MDKVIYCGFQTVSGESEFFRQSTIGKGKKLYASGHIDSVREVTNLGMPSITAKCLSQVSVSKIYDVSFKTTVDRKITEGRCSCKAGVRGRCKHVAALLHHINEHLDDSRTAEKQSWGIPKVKAGYSKGKSLQDLFPRLVTSEPLPSISIRQVIKSFPGIDCPLYTAIIAQDKKQSETEIMDVMKTLLKSVCEGELQETLLNILSKEDNSNCLHKSYQCQTTGSKLILKNSLLTLSPSSMKTYQEEVHVQLHDIIHYAKLTIKQADSPLWRKLRKIRMPSSMCHRVVTRTGNFKQLAESIINESFSGNVATRYGQKLERAAKASFSFKMNIPLLTSGVVISPDTPWLCCSPDALFTRNGTVILLEVKCPHSRKGLKITEGGKSYVGYLKFDGSRFYLNPTHKYYTQVQVAMYVLKLKQCEFFVYSAVDNVTVLVERDDVFLQNAISKLHYFYFNHFLNATKNN